VTYEEYIKAGLPSRKEIDVFSRELSWARFDPEVGYILGNYIPHDGIDNSSTLSTTQADRARSSFVYAGKPCRINTYGNSFTQCHQVSDGETWQEYLAAHLGEPVRNFGMGGYGFYQSYRRMLQEERTDHAAEYIILYLWGDDHIRSLLRCRYMLTQGWMRDREKQEEVGKMFHGNFWPNVEMDLEKGELTEKESLIRAPGDLFKMNDPDWMVENLRDDLALQMALFERKKITKLDMNKLKKLILCLNLKMQIDDSRDLTGVVRLILDKYAFAATSFILGKAREFEVRHHKKLMIVLFDPYKVTRSLIENRPRYDQEIVDYLQVNHFNYFDMNLVHAEDFKDFNLTPEEYYKRYFIGHYSPAGNHFFAFSIKPKIVEWLDPKPITYKPTNQQFIDFKGYLEDIE
jgi:hypothetical protein